MPRQDLIQYRRGTAATWASVNPTLAAGEVGFATDANEIRVGDGVTPWLNLETVGLGQDAVVAEVVENTMRLRASVLNTAAQGAVREYPMIRNAMDGPIFSKNSPGQALNSLYWPYLVDRWQSPLGRATIPAEERYGVYFSTDHASEPAAGIALATAPHPTSTVWKQYGKIYKDNVDGGTQTETPSVMWNEATQVWMMFYQNANVGQEQPGGQATLLATSTDGINWTRYGIVAERGLDFPGVVHTGYFRPFRVAGKWYAYSLSGASTTTFWYSDDGYNWKRDARQNPRQADLLTQLPGYTEAGSWSFKLTNSAILDWNGRLWAIAVSGAYASGGDVTQDLLTTAPLSEDKRSITEAPKNITPPLQDWQTVTQGLGSAVRTDDGKIYLIQRANSQSGAFFIMEVY